MNISYDVILFLITLFKRHYFTITLCNQQRVSVYRFPIIIVLYSAHECLQTVDFGVVRTLVLECYWKIYETLY